MATVGVDYSFLRRLVQGYSHNVLDDSRDYLFDSRLGGLIRTLGMSRLEDLVDHLRRHKDPALVRMVGEAMTINETSFFRDQRPFELLRTELLPRLIERRRSTRCLRFWSAACSTGQEAVSLAILLHEHFSHILHWNIRIEGTDISSEVIERARAARYHRIEVNRGLPVRTLIKYFEQEDDHWVARKDVRDLCHFQQANLCAPSSWSQPFDVVLLRNVMLYFSEHTRKAVLENLHRVTADDGVIVLGVSEQAAYSPLWTPVLAGGTCYYRKAGTGDKE
jgi:chemotaxis protein methyltransferase CheR